jgi:hypothetical protein
MQNLVGKSLGWPVGLSPPYPGLQEQTPGSTQEPWQEAGQLGWLQNIPVGEGGHFLILLIFTLALLEVRTILPPLLAIP